MKKEPQYKPYKRGYEKVKDGHTLYYELYGNPKGKPVVYLHGGPGAGFQEKDKRFFDPKVWNVLFFDQRGAGRSKPYASLKNNTTWDIVSDISFLMERHGFEKAYIFGGSWGSTLALVFAITHPEKVLGMILRGIWLGTGEEIDYMFEDVRLLRPALWERFMKLVPEKKRGGVAEYYYEKMQSKNAKTRDLYAYEWAYYESGLLKLQVNEKDIVEDMKDGWYKALSPLEAHYYINLCFLTKDFILKNAQKIAHLPISIIHGEYDLVCPPISAYRLHKKLPMSVLHMVHAGHSSSDPEIEKTFIEEAARFGKFLDTI